MTTDDRTWRSAPPFDHIVVGLPGDVVDAEKPPPGRPFKRRRFALPAGVAVVLLVGSLGGAHAVRQNLQTDVPPPKVVAEVPRVDLAEAAELQASLAELEEFLESARDARDDSLGVLAESDADLLQELDDAIAAAEGLLEADAMDLEMVATVATDLGNATEAVEAAADRGARETLAMALAAANEVHAQSAGRVQDDQVRAGLGEAIEEAQAALESDAGLPRELVERARQLDEQTEAVAEAMALYEQEQAQLPEPPPAPAPVVEPPATNDPPSDSPRPQVPGGREPTPTPAPRSTTPAPTPAPTEGSVTPPATDPSPPATDPPPQTDPTVEDGLGKLPANED